MKLRYTLSAGAHHAAIYNYLLQQNLDMAPHVMMQIYRAVLWLRTFPHIGRRGSVPGTREWVVRGFPYIIVYEISGDEILILAFGAWIYSVRGA